MSLFVEAGKVWAAVALCERRRGMFLYLLSFFIVCYFFVVICCLSLFVICHYLLKLGKLGQQWLSVKGGGGCPFICYLLFVICYLLFVVCCLLFVVCCLLFVFCYLLSVIIC